MTSLIHDACHRAAVSCLAVIAACLREEEHKDAYEAFYEVIRKEMGTLADRLGRRERRLRGASPNGGESS